MTPPTVNADYDPQRTTSIFPQECCAPLFSALSDAAPTMATPAPPWATSSRMPLTTRAASSTRRAITQLVDGCRPQGV